MGSLFIALAMDGGTSAWGSVCAHVMGIGSRLTSSEAALVNPGVHVCALILELLKLIAGVLDLVLEVFNLIEVGSDGIVEGLGQWIRGGFHHVCRSDGTGVCVNGGDRASTRGGVVTLVAGGGGSKGLQSVLGIETAGVLGIFVWWTLD